MSRLQCRGSIAGAAVVVALLSSRPADAQVGVDPGPPREPGGLLNDLVTGVEYDIVNQALAEQRLQNLQAKLRRDAERGDMAAVDCDVRRIDNVKYRIAIDEWLIRWNSRQYPGFYPIRTDAVSCAAIAQATHPTPISLPPAACPDPGTDGRRPDDPDHDRQCRAGGGRRRLRHRWRHPSGPRRLAPGPGRGPRLEHHLRRWRIARPAPVSDLAGSLRVPIDRRGVGAIQACGQALNRRWDPTIGLDPAVLVREMSSTAFR